MAEPFKKYQLLKKLAVGGMGTVYLARIAIGPSTGRLVCLKCVSEEHARDLEYRRLFESEIRVMLGFSHANLVTLLDAGDEGGKLFITLDWIEGRNLREILNGPDGKSVPLDPAIAIGIAIGAAEGLHYAHTYFDRATNEPSPVIHRDISPTNVLVGFDGGVKIIDFGIARRLTETAPTHGARMGKLSYMAPEQVVGEPTDARTDVFALGIVLWELLTGEGLFTGKTSGEVVWKVTSSDFHILPVSAKIRGIPPALDVALSRALARSRESRHDSMQDFRNALQKALRQIDPEFRHDRIASFILKKFAAALIDERAEVRSLCEAAIPSEATEILTPMTYGKNATYAAAAPSADTVHAPEPEAIDEGRTHALRSPVRPGDVSSIDGDDLFPDLEDELGEETEIGMSLEESEVVDLDDDSPDASLRSLVPSDDDDEGADDGVDDVNSGEVGLTNYRRPSDRQPPDRRPSAFSGGGIAREFGIAATIAPNLETIPIEGAPADPRTPIDSSRPPPFRKVGGSNASSNPPAHGTDPAATQPPLPSPSQATAQSASTSNRPGNRVAPPPFEKNWGTQGRGTRPIAKETGSPSKSAIAAGIAVAIVSGILILGRVGIVRIPGWTTIDVTATPAGATLVPARVRFFPDSVDAKARVAGREIDSTSGSIRVPLEIPFEVEATLDGFVPFRKTVTVSRNDPMPYPLDLRFTPENPAALSVSTNLSAQVEIVSGNLRWSLPTPIDSLALPEGTYRVTIRNLGLNYEKVQDIAVRRGKSPRIVETIEVRRPAGQAAGN